ncbi:MAG: molybdopterin-dependent oxidoreductase [Deinococcales bacterium]
MTRTFYDFAAIVCAMDMHTQELRTTCPLDCPDACSLILTSQDGKVTKLKGNPQHPNTQGFACVKMYEYPKRQYHETRLRQPLKRIGAKGEGRFAPISWDEALNDIATKLKAVIAEHGSESILPYSYAGTMGLLERDRPLAFFRALGTSELDWTICAATGGAAWEANYGPMRLSPDPEDVPYADFIILWGIDVMRSNLHLVPKLKAAKKRGTRIIHIDPFYNETSELADLHLAIKVGTDAALALAIGNIILSEGLEDKTYLANYANDLEAYRQAASLWPVEKAASFCDAKAEHILELAHSLTKHKASYIRVGYGMTRNESGGNALRAVTLLPALTGAWQHRGGGAALSTSGAFALNSKRYSGKHLLKPNVRHINMNCLGSALAQVEDPIKALFVFNSNPAAVAPDSSKVRQGLAREDLFTVVLEHFQTDSADYADYLLPATTFLEHPDLYTAYGHYHLQWAEPVVAPEGQAKPNSWVFAELAKRLGLQDESLYLSAEETAKELLSSDHPFLEGINFELLKEKSSLKLSLPENFRPYSQGSSFADGKIHFSPPPQQLEFCLKPSADYPLRLISPPGKHMLNTSMGNMETLIKASGGEPMMMINPKDAERYGIRDEMLAEIISPQGSIRRKILVSAKAKEGTLVALGQWWPKLAPDKKSLNDLTSELLTDLGGGSTFGNMVVRVVPL